MLTAETNLPRDHAGQAWDLDQMVDILGTYSNYRGPGESTLSLIADANRCRDERRQEEIPQGIRSAPRARVKALRAEEIDELVVAYLGGGSTYTLAHRFGVHRSTVTAHLERRGVGRRLRGHQPAPPPAREG